MTIPADRLPRHQDADLTVDVRVPEKSNGARTPISRPVLVDRPILDERKADAPDSTPASNGSPSTAPRRYVPHQHAWRAPAAGGKIVEPPRRLVDVTEPRRPRPLRIWVVECGDCDDGDFCARWGVCRESPRREGESDRDWLRRTRPNVRAASEMEKALSAGTRRKRKRTK